MEEAARVISKAFSNCVTDRYWPSSLSSNISLISQLPRQSPYAESRKWGVYYVVGLILKCYFRVCASLVVWITAVLTSDTGETNIAVEEHPTRH